jgi:hypothetical protein
MMQQEYTMSSALVMESMTIKNTHTKRMMLLERTSNSETEQPLRLAQRSSGFGITAMSGPMRWNTGVIKTTGATTRAWPSSTSRTWMMGHTARHSKLKTETDPKKPSILMMLMELTSLCRSGDGPLVHGRDTRHRLLRRGTMKCGSMNGTVKMDPTIWKSTMKHLPLGIILTMLKTNRLDSGLELLNKMITRAGTTSGSRTITELLTGTALLTENAPLKCLIHLSLLIQKL